MWRKRRKFLLYSVVFVVALSGLLAATRNIWCPYLFTSLDTGKPPHQADIIVVLSGGWGYRTQYAAELYNEGYAPRIILSIDNTLIDNLLAITDSAGIPREDILTIRSGSNTWEESRIILTQLESLHVRSALIVTDSYHSRRAGSVYKSLNKNPELDLTIVASPGRFTANNWWKGEGKSVIIHEYESILLYLFRYRVLPFG